MATHSLIDASIPVPLRRELDHVELAAPPLAVWEALRDGTIAWPFLVRALQRVRARSLPAHGRRGEPPLGLGGLRSTLEHPGLQLLGEEHGRELTLGALAAMRPFTFELLPIADLDAFARSCEPGLVRLMWSLRLSPIGSTSSRLRVELRIDATDRITWLRFRRIYLVLGPALRLLRRRVLASLADQFGAHELTIARTAGSAPRAVDASATLGK